MRPLPRIGSMLLLLPAFLATDLIVPKASAQYPPTPYPPGTTYPPGSYPPGTQYPDNRYPQRIPGGPTIGIPIPEIKIPKRGGKPKESDKAKEEEKSGGATQARTGPAQDNLRAITGVMRKLSDRELLLQAEKHGILRFRVLAKTSFQDAQGEPMRDSLIKPGDVISAQFNAIDEETILIVQYVRAGTPEERAAGAKDVDLAAVKTPENLISEPVRGSTSSTRKTGSEIVDDDRPVLRRSNVGEISETIQPKSDDAIDAAREQAAGIDDSLPNFLVTQHTTRYVGNGTPANWHAVDIVSADVAYVNGSEEYRNIKINGKPTSRDPQKTGSWSTGEFATTLQDILSPTTGAAFTFRSRQSMGGRTVLVYDLRVPQSRSHWQIIAPDGRKYRPAYKGSVSIDEETKHVLKIEQYSISLPNDFPFENASWMVEYDAVRIDNGRYMLPVRGETGTCSREGGQCSRNEVVFHNYRKFGAESEIKYDKFTAQARD